MWARTLGMSVAMVTGLSGIGPQATGAPGERECKGGHPVLRHSRPGLGNGLSHGGEGPVLRIQQLCDNEFAAFKPKSCRYPKEQ